MSKASSRSRAPLAGNGRTPPRARHQPRLDRGSTALPRRQRPYGATKAFVEQFTRNLRADLVGTGVRATNLAPGLCGGTEFSNVRFRGDDDAAAKVYAGTHPLTAADIAATAYWIATLPAHVNVNHIELMPTCQGYGPLNIKRES